MLSVSNGINYALCSDEKSGNQVEKKMISI